MNSTNINQALKELKQGFDKEMKKIRQDGVEVVLFAHETLVKGSPTDTGLYRNNHIITQNHTTTNFNEKEDKTNNPTTDAMSDITGLKFNDGDKIYIQNNLSYADKLEAMGGKSEPPLLYARTEKATQRFIKDISK